MALDEILADQTDTISVVVCEEGDFATLFMQTSMQADGQILRRIRGSKCRTTAGMFDEVGAALQFPYYFGENFDALNDCLLDLDWMLGSAYVFFICDAHQLLESEDTSVLRAFYEIFHEAAKAWETPATEEAKKIPFRLVLHCPPAAADEFRVALSDVLESL